MKTLTTTTLLACTWMAVAGCTAAPSPQDVPMDDAARVVLDARPAVGCQAQGSPPRLRVGQVAADGRRCLILQFRRGDGGPVQYEHVTVAPGVPMLLLRTEETCQELVSRAELPTDEEFGEFPVVGTGWVQLDGSEQPREVSASIDLEFADGTTETVRIDAFRLDGEICRAPT